MNRDLENTLKSKYPILLRKMHEDIYAPLGMGIELGDDCYDILDKLFSDITEHEIARDLVDFEYKRTVLKQVKEKFCSCRIYYIGGDSYVHDLISETENILTQMFKEEYKKSKLEM